MCCFCVVGQVCYVTTIAGNKHFEDLLFFSYNSYHVHTFEMTKGSKTMKKRTPKPTNQLHTQEMTKGNKIIIKEENNNEKHVGVGQVGLGFGLLIERKGNNEEEGNNNQVIHCCYCFLHTMEERGEQDYRGGKH
jgi:hypothetical protein